MHLGIVALLKLVFIQLGSSCATLSGRGGSRRAFWILGSRNFCGQWEKTHLCVYLGENTVTVTAFVVLTYHEHKLFLWHFWLGCLIGKTRDEREEKEISKGLSVSGRVCVCVHAWGGKRDRNSKGEKIKRVWKVGGKWAEESKPKRKQISPL